MIKNLFEQVRSLFKQIERRKLLILSLAIVGVVFIMISDLFKQDEKAEFSLLDEEDIEETIKQDRDQLISDIKEMEQEYEKGLQAMLNKLSGVTEVEVMVNIDSTNVQMYEKDVVLGQQTTIETDQSGGQRTVEDETKETRVVHVRQGDEEVPVLLKTEKPQVRGVFIIAKGVENAAVKQQVVEAVSRVLDVPTYRISVLPK